MTKITVKLFKEALKGSIGTQTDIAKRLNVTPGAVAQYLQRNPKMVPLVEKKRLQNIDRAEHEIFEQLDFNDYTKEPASAARIRQGAAIYILSRLGKSRGWVEKQEIEHMGEGVKINVNVADEIKELFEKKD